jgi:hypothetical protein
MTIQYGKMILHGILSAIFYIVVPLVLFYFLETYHIMTFSESFRIIVIIFGIVGVFMSILRHAYPVDTSANRLIAFFASIYAGVYLFYIFGGFTPGVSLGTYAIDLPTIQVLLGLQLIAWLLLGSTIVRAIQYLIEAIELRKKKEYRTTGKKQFKVSRIFKALGTLIGLVILGYFGTLIYSGLNIKPALHPIGPSDVSYSGGNLNITLTFDLSNQGIYALYNVSVGLDLYTITSTNASILPENTKIGESISNYVHTFHSFTNTPNQQLTVGIYPIYVYGLATTIANLKFVLSFSTFYAGITADVNISQVVSWPSLI